MKNLMTSIIAMAILVLAALGCSNADDKSANTSNTTFNSSSNDSKSNSNSTTLTSKKDDIEGTYGITGTIPSKQAYQGDLTIKKQDEVYQFSWSVGGSAYDGVGVRARTI